MEHGLSGLRSNEVRAKNAITLIWIVMGLEVLTLGSNYMQHSLLQHIASGGEVTAGEAALNDSRVQLIAILSLVAFVVSIVTFIQWFRRAYYNLHQSTGNLAYSEGWAAGSWFVPILNLFRPYQIMTELYSRTATLLSQKDIPLKKYMDTQFLGFWWGLWIVNNMVGNYTFRTSMKSETIDSMLTVSMVEMVGNVIMIALSLITIKVIKDYSINESLLFELNKETEEDTATATEGVV
jgi:hypothetical protein